MILRAAALSLVFATTALTTLSSVAHAEESTPAKPKATKASVTALKVKIEKGRDDIRALAKLPAPAGLTAAQRKSFDAEIAKLAPLADGADGVAQAMDASLRDPNVKLDAVGANGELESLRMQMAMDRMAKAMQLLSNLLKKHSDTSSQIAQNMK